MTADGDRLDYLMSRMDILDCVNRIARGVDRLDREIFRTGYHADAVLDFGSDWLEDVMSGQELKALGKLPENRLGGAVSRLWTLKEAYVKMLGTGIAEVGDVAFDLSDDRLLSGGSNDRFVQPVFRTWIVANQGHRYSVALASSRSVVSRTPLSCRLSEGPRVNSRDEFPILAG